MGGGVGWDGGSIEAVCALGSASHDPAMPGRLLFTRLGAATHVLPSTSRGQRPHLLTSTGLDRKLLLISATSTLPPTSGAPCGVGGMQCNAEPAAIMMQRCLAYPQPVLLLHDPRVR